jgi:hypothetical protein
MNIIRELVPQTKDNLIKIGELKIDMLPIDNTLDIDLESKDLYLIRFLTRNLEINLDEYRVGIINNEEFVRRQKLIRERLFYCYNQIQDKRGPVAYYTNKSLLCPPPLKLWAVARGFPRRHSTTTKKLLKKEDLRSI